MLRICGSVWSLQHIAKITTAPIEWNLYHFTLTITWTSEPGSAAAVVWTFYWITACK